jgi:predicted dehydrogenase
MSAHRVRIGILGTARIAGKALIEPARAVPSVSVAAVAARDAARASEYAKSHEIPAVFASYEELLASPEVDAVYVPLPNALHAPWTLRAIAAGKHVLCEKPFTSNAAEAVQVATAAEESGLVVMEAMHYRYHPLVQRLTSLLADGAIGTPSHAQAWTSWPIDDPADIRYDFALGGGALMDGGCYAIDCLRLVAGSADGEPAPVVAGALADPLPDGLVDRATAARLTFPEGMTGWFESAFTRDGEFRADVHVIGDQGHLWLRNFVNAHFGRLVVTRNGSEVSDESASDLRRYDEAGDTTFAWQLRAFAAAVLDGTPFPTTAASAVTTMRLIDDAYTAAGLPVRAPEQELAPADAAARADGADGADGAEPRLGGGAAVQEHPGDEFGIVGHRDVPAAGQGDELGMRQPLPGAAGLPGRQHAIFGAPRDRHRHVRRYSLREVHPVSEHRVDRVTGVEEGDGIGLCLFGRHPRRLAHERAVDDAPANRAAHQRGHQRPGELAGQLRAHEDHLDVTELPVTCPEPSRGQPGHGRRQAARTRRQRQRPAQRVAGDMRAVQPEFAEEREQLFGDRLHRGAPGGD